MGFLRNLGGGDDSILFFILIFLLLFCSDIFGGNDCCDRCGNDNDNSILFFIILFLLLFNGNDRNCCDRRDIGCGC